MAAQMAARVFQVGDVAVTACGACQKPIPSGVFCDERCAVKFFTDLLEARAYWQRMFDQHHIPIKVRVI